MKERNIAYFRRMKEQGKYIESMEELGEALILHGAVGRVVRTIAKVRDKKKAEEAK